MVKHNIEHELEKLMRDVTDGVSGSLSQLEKILQHREGRAQAGMFGSDSGSHDFKDIVNALGECKLELAQITGEQASQYRLFSGEVEALFNPSTAEAHAPAA